MGNLEGDCVKISGASRAFMSPLLNLHPGHDDHIIKICNRKNDKQKQKPMLNQGPWIKIFLHLLHKQNCRATYLLRGSLCNLLLLGKK